MSRTLAQAIVDDFRKELELTRPALAAVPQARFAWKPHEKSMPLGRLAGHIAENALWAPMMMEDEVDFASAAADWKPFDPQTAEELTNKLEEGARVFSDTVTGRDDRFLSAMWRMRAGDQVFYEAPRHEALRTFGIHHLIHHRGQLSVYLRLVGATVPETYGPTADSPSPT